MPSETRPEISVIIPVYNRTSELATCLAGLFSQTHGAELQVIVVDDASTEPGLENLTAAYQATCIRLKRRYGSAYCKNLGLLNAEGEYVLFLDSDIEFITRSTVSSMLRAVKTIPNCGQVGGEAIVDCQGQLRYVFGRNIDLQIGASRCDYVPIVDSASPNEVWEFDYIPTSNCMMRRKTAWDLGGFDDAYPCLGEDKDFGYRVKKLGLRNYVLRDSVVIHRFSVTGRPKNVLRNQYRTQIRFYMRHFGVNATVKMVLRQTQNQLCKCIRPVQGACEADPAIRRFEDHYREAILRLRGNEGAVGKVREALRCVWTFLAAFLWNLVRRDGLHQPGSSKLAVLIRYQDLCYGALSLFGRRNELL